MVFGCHYRNKLFLYTWWKDSELPEDEKDELQNALPPAATGLSTAIDDAIDSQIQNSVTWNTVRAIIGFRRLAEWFEDNFDTAPSRIILDNDKVFKSK